MSNFTEVPIKEWKMPTLSAYTIESIQRIVADCEEFCASGVARYDQEQEQRNAYKEIAELVLDDLKDQKVAEANK